LSFKYSLSLFLKVLNTSFMSYIDQIISIYLAWIVQPLQFRLLPLVLIILNIFYQTVVYAVLTHNLHSLWLKFLYSL
jgi:hypothetical protein